MGYALRRMIRDGAPRSWTSLMRDVAKEIADDARDPDDNHPLTEGKWPWSKLHVEGYRDRHGRWHDGLAEICGVTSRAISDALTALGRAGYEMRQPIRRADGTPVTDKRGRVVYAAKGHALEFWVPLLPPRPEPESTHEGATIDLSTHQSATNEAQRSHPDVSKVAPECDPFSSLSPHEDLSPHPSQSPQSVVSLSATSVEGEPPAVEGDEEDFETRRRRFMDALMAMDREQTEVS